MAAPRSLWMALVLLGVLGVPPASAQASEQPGFQQEQFLGRWFTAGLASNASWFRERKAGLSMCSAVVAPAGPGDGDGALRLTTTFLRRDQCETRSLLLRPAGAPGHYSYTSLHSGGTQDVWVEEADYGEYALLYTAGGAGDRGFHMATLYSRTQTPRAAVRDKFAAFAAAKGFAEEDVAFPPKTDKCLEGPQ